MKLFSMLPAVLFVPLLISQTPLPSISKVSSTVSVAGSAKVQVAAQDLTIQRKLRIERLLISLDKAASVAIQMHPQNSERLELVIVDLAEQTLNLVGGSEIQNVKTDAELDRLELTVGQLVRTMNRMIEPEMSL